MSWIEMPRRSSLLPPQGVLSFRWKHGRDQAVHRRSFITLLGGAAAWPFAARAQQAEHVRRIVVLMTGDDAEGQARMTAFLRGLQQLGWVDGSNVRIEARWTAGKADNVRRHVAELAALAPDVIMATGSAIVGPLLQSIRAVPIVFAQVP